MKFTEILDEYGVEYKTGGHHHSTSGYIQLDCPNCSPNWKKFRLGYNLNQGFFSCWVCKGLPLFDTLSLLINESVGKCRQLLRGLDQETIRWETKTRSKLVLPSGIGSLQPPHNQYLQSRGFDPVMTSRMWGVQGIGIAPKLSWRLFIPIVHRGVTISWTTRSISDKVKSRYINAGASEESFPAKKFLYGEDLANHSLIVVEGPLDAWAIGPGAVATMGVNYSQAQVRRMSKYPCRVVMFDSDEPGRVAANKLADVLSVFSGETFVVPLQSGKDAASADPKEIQEIRKRFLS